MTEWRDGMEAPEDGKPILADFGDGVCIGWYIGKRKWKWGSADQTGDNMHVHPPLCWMPLPETPA